MKEKGDFALVPRLPGSIEKPEPGAKRILSGMVADTLALVRREPPHINRPLRIVMVDDDEYRFHMVEMAISLYFKGVTVQSFLDAEEALQELSQTDPDLLITDDIMPKLQGEDIVRRLADRKVAYPIIVYSGWDGPETEQWVSEYAGSGLNVALVQILAPSHPENLLRALESALRIPRDSATPDETKPIKNQTKTLKPRGKLLIVDDEDGVRQCMRVIFEDEYDLFLAGDGPTAIELAKQNDIDVAVTDLRMAGMSGIEVLEQLKSLKPDIEVIIMTGYETADTRRQALRLGACDYINTPFDCSTMRAAISKAMQHRRLESEIAAARKQSSSNMERVADLTLQTRPLRIVILDDEPFVCDAIRVMLHFDLPNAEILTFTNAEAALEELEREDPDLFTTDFEHPGTRGDELLQILAKRKVKYPVFVISAYAPEDVLLYAGPDLNVTLLRKPVTMEQLRALLLKHLGPARTPGGRF